MKRWWYQNQEYTLFPNCACHDNLVHFQTALETEHYTWPQIQSIAHVIATNLTCVSMHCPDPETRAWAERQLLDPFWKFLGEPRDLEMEDFEEHRRWKAGQR